MSRLVNHGGALLGAILMLVASTAVAQTGGALDFQGTQYVEVADPIALDGPLTLEAWVRPDVFDDGRVLSDRDGSNGYELDIIPGGNVRFTVNANVRCQVNISGYLGVWTHLAVTWTGPADGVITMYVDGEPAATNTWNGDIVAPGGAFEIGRSALGNSMFDGAIDEVRVFSAAVSSETIKVWSTRHVDASHPDYAHLEAAWNFEEGSGQTATNVTGDTGRDGRLGSTAGADAADPTWIVSGMTPTEPISFGKVKSLYR